MKFLKIMLALGALCLFPARCADAGPLKVVTTITDLASITREIGGEHVSVTCLTSGAQDPHFVEPRPSMVAQLRDADLLVVVGMELDVWVFALIDAARNRQLVPGGTGYLNVSARVEKLEVPEQGVRIDASKGHVHPAGNPHYLVDPVNGRVVAETIADRLAELAPAHRPDFQANLDRFKRRSERQVAEISARLAPFGEIRAIAYHKSWEYFARRFGLKIVGYLEPLPGIAPSPRHLNETVTLARAQRVSLILQESLYDRRAADFVSLQAGVPVAVAPVYVGAVPAAGDYFALFDTITARIVAALESRAAR